VLEDAVAGLGLCRQLILNFRKIRHNSHQGVLKARRIVLQKGPVRQ
jgi:hypothetical protein